MAMVPDYGAPQVAPSAGAGTNGFSFQAMQAPEVKIADTIEKGVQKWAGIQASIQEETDDAIATDAVTKASRYFDDLYFNPERGFGTLRGEAALKTDADGKSPFDRMIEMADAEVQRLCEGKSKNQVARIKAKLMPSVDALYGRGLQHMVTQNHNFNVGSRAGAIEENINHAYRNFNDPAILIRTRQDVINNAKKLAQLTGEDEKVTVRANLSKFHGSVLAAHYVQGAADPSQFAAGAAYLKRNKAEIDGNVIMSYDAKFTAGAKDFESYNVADRVYNDLKGTSETVALNARTTSVAEADPTKPLQAGDAFRYVSIGIKGDQFTRNDRGVLEVSKTKRGGEVGIGSAGVTESMARAVLGKNISAEQWKEEWEKIKADPGYNRTIAARFIQLAAQKYGDTHQALAAYVGGDADVDNALKQAKEKGGVWTEYLSADTKAQLNTILKRMDDQANAPVIDSDGNVLNTLNPKAAYVATHVPTYGEIRDKVKSQPYASDLAWLEKTIGQVTSRFNRDKQDRANRKNEIIDRICTDLENGKKPSEELMSQLTRREQLDLLNWHRNNSSKGNLGDVEYLAYLIKNPAELGNMTQAEARNASRLVPKGSRNRLMQMWQEIQHGKEQGLTAEYITSQGGTALGKTRLAIGAAREVIQSFGYDIDADQLYLSAVQLGEAMGREAAINGVEYSTPEEARAAARRIAAQQFTTDSWGWGVGKRKPIFTFKYSDFSGDARDVSKQLAANLFGRDPDDTTKEERAAALIHLIGNKVVQFSENTLKKIIESDPEIMKQAYASVRRKAEASGDLKGMDAQGRDAFIRKLLRDNTTILREFLEESQRGWFDRESVPTTMQPYSGDN